ncbi:unnamed protein product [Cylindrotheca closterium]|uniref:Uncharacterized protein n=1 Tax=Cylindrotheca closterium TaxID=2856 RepID=A0AAD2G279_9STRA|nr:unnamed protein product [Cylindrotheca closterium]
MAITATSTINSAGVIWGYSAGAIPEVDEEDEDLSERFAVMRAAPTSDYESTKQQQQQQQVEATIPEHRDIDAIWSYAAGDAGDEEEEELSERFSLMRAAPTSANDQDEAVPPLPATIDEHSESSSSESPPFLFHDRKDEVHMTPRTMISKLLPSKNRSRDELSKSHHTMRQVQKKPLVSMLSPVRQSVYKMNRTDCRSQLESSFCKLDSANDLPSIKQGGLTSHTSAPCFGRSTLNNKKGNTKSKESSLMSMMRADLQPKKSSDKKKSKKSKSGSSSTKERSHSPKRSPKKSLKSEDLSVESPSSSVSPKRSSKKSLKTEDRHLATESPSSSLSPKRSSKKSLKGEDRHAIVSPSSSLSPRRSKKKKSKDGDEGSKSPKTKHSSKKTEEEH